MNLLCFIGILFFVVTRPKTARSGLNFWEWLGLLSSVPHPVSHGVHPASNRHLGHFSTASGQPWCSSSIQQAPGPLLRRVKPRVVHLPSSVAYVWSNWNYVFTPRRFCCVGFDLKSERKLTLAYLGYFVFWFTRLLLPFFLFIFSLP